MANAIWLEKEKKWSLRITENGKTKKFTSTKAGLAGKKEVLKRARQWQDKGPQTRHNLRVEEVWELFMQDNETRLGKESGTYRYYQRIGRSQILPAIGQRKMNSISKAEFQKIINSAKPMDKSKTSLSKKYVSNIKMTITLFIRYASDNGYCEPLSGSLYVPKNLPVVGKEILQPSDLKKLFIPSDFHYHYAFLMMACTGLRPGECLGLKWSDIEGEVIRIQRAVNSYGYITEGKTENAKRFIPLSPMIQQILNAQKERTKSLNSEFIFCSIDGSHGVQKTMRNQFAQLKKERDLPGCPYSLRHTFISMMKFAMPDSMLRSVVGHSNSFDTYGTYGFHHVEGESKQVAEIIDLKLNQIQKLSDNK